MVESTEITVAYGDGIGPEIMEATLFVLKEVRANIRIDVIEVGQAYYERGVTTGIPPYVWDSIRRSKVLLKAPVTTPQGGGYKSLNVTLRKTLGLSANLRPCRSYHPFVSSLHPATDVVIVRENEEDIYSGIEYRQSEDLYHAVKVITRSGSERIARTAFDYAKQHGRRKVTCMSKDNIMQFCDGTFHAAFDAVAAEYPDIESEHMMIDIGAARLATRPEAFDVIVTENLYGDILSDIAAELCGSVGMAGSANIGMEYAMFEAIHGSAPDIAGQGIANPSGLLNAAVMMLNHIGQQEAAATIHNAWLKTIEDGIHTADIFGEHSKEQVGTHAFAEAVVANLWDNPSTFAVSNFGEDTPRAVSTASEHIPASSGITKTLVGVDVSVAWEDTVEELAELVMPLAGEKAMLTTISSKGLKVFPHADSAAFNTDQLRCRLTGEAPGEDYPADLLARLHKAGLEVLKAEVLFDFDGERGYSLSQGE